MTKIAIFGTGNVGSALARGLSRAGNEVQPIGATDRDTQRALARGADVIVLAVPFGALGDVAAALGDAADGKIVVDATNALDANMQLALGYTTSGAEELQRKLPAARVVKAFNTVFAQHMDTGKVAGQALTALVAADDAAAKDTVLGLARAIGFEPVDAGPLANARLLEPLAYLNIQLGYMLGLGTQIGFKLVRG